jgi:O-antigen/teichoic acid export membrane protein
MAGGTLLKATFTLLAGGAVAQLIPLLIGPLLTRLYTPSQFGLYHLFVAVAANVAVVACARYEFALPLVRGSEEAQALSALCLRVLVAVVMATTLAALVWWGLSGDAWPMWLPVAVALLGLVSLATLQATAGKRFRALAVARVVQHGGGAVAQAGAGLAGAGVAGLIAAPLLALAATAAVLGLRVPGAFGVPGDRVRQMARRFQDFPKFNTPHAFLGALSDTVSIALVAALAGPAAAGFWGLTMRYLKAPATLVGGAVSQALYPHLADSAAPGVATAKGRSAVLRVMGLLALIAVPLVLGIWLVAPWAFEALFGPDWRDAGELASALALYIGVHFVAAPLAIVTMVWGAQAWALRLAAVGQAMFVGALAWGLTQGGLVMAGWCVSAAMLMYFGWYFVCLARWPVPAAVPMAEP